MMFGVFSCCLLEFGKLNPVAMPVYDKPLYFGQIYLDEPNMLGILCSLSGDGTMTPFSCRPGFFSGGEGSIRKRKELSGGEACLSSTLLFGFARELFVHLQSYIRVEYLTWWSGRVRPKAK